MKRRAMQRLAWGAVASGTAMATGLLTRRALHRGWRAVTDEEPPLDPSREGVAWPAALAWAATTGAVVAISRLAAKRGARAVWTRALGSEPPRRRRR
jgi:hypothetical protein